MERTADARMRSYRQVLPRCTDLFGLPISGEHLGSGGTELVRYAPFFEKRAVDPLGVNAAVLGRLDRPGDLHQLAGGALGIS
jgi:hypothetical protein